MLFLRAELCLIGREGWRVWRRGERKKARRRRRKPWSATWGSSGRLEGGGEMEVAEKLERRDHLHSFHVWEHRTVLEELP